MGLSNSPKDTLSTYQVLLDIAQGLQALGKNPDLAQLAKDAYALPQVEIDKANAAKDIIAQAENIKKAQEDAIAQINAEQDNLDMRAAQIKDALALIEAKNATLDTRQKNLNNISDAQALLVKDLEKRESALAGANIKLSQDKDALDQRDAAITERENKVKQRIEALKQDI